jgi:hypothetical protein
MKMTLKGRNIHHFKAKKKTYHNQGYILIWDEHKETRLNVVFLNILLRHFQQINLVYFLQWIKINTKLLIKQQMYKVQKA